MGLKLAAALLLASIAVPATAQQPPAIGQRVDKLEREMRAVQRKVFPGGGNQQYFDAEIAPPATDPAPGIPATSPVADLATRVFALEQEITRLTGEVEQNSFKLRQLEEQFARFQGGGPAPAIIAPAPPVALPAPAVAPPIETAPPFTPAPAPTASGRQPTGDAAEDAYLAGYDQWAAKDFKAAQATLRGVGDKYPDHRRASYARNLYGRALLDDGQPASAAKIFYENYQKQPRGERAPDSLFYLGQALMALKPPKPADACKVYDELLDVYGAKMEAALRDRVAKGKADAKCGS